MPVSAIRASAYGEQPLHPPPTGHKPHHTHSAASGGGVSVGGDNPALNIKHPNFCPQCGESLSPPSFIGGALPIPDGPLGNLGSAPMSLTGGPQSGSGAAEMTGAPATGASAHKRRKAKAGTKLKSKPGKKP